MFKKTMNFDPKYVSKIPNAIYKIAGEQVIRAMAISQHGPQMYVKHVEDGQIAWPDVSVTDENGNIKVTITQKGELLHEQYVEDECEADDATPSVPRLAEIMEVVNQHLIGQVDAKRACARAVKLHMERCYGESVNDGVTLDKQNVFVHGPTASGKTEIWRIIAKHLGVNCFIEDASLLTPSSYKGRNVSELACDIWTKCGKDMEAAGFSIVVLDEFDKLGAGAGAERTSVLNDLLKFIEGGEIPFKECPSSKETQFLNTENMLIVTLGAFDGIEALYEARGSIGFGAPSVETSTPSRNDIIDKLNADAFKKWGFKSELLGRLPISVGFKELTEEELVEIQLNIPNSIYNQWKEYFSRLDQRVSFSITKPVAEYIAKQAIAEKTGARNLVSQYATLLTEVYEKAEMDENITEVKIGILKGQPNVTYGHSSKVLESMFSSMENEN
tara:strand:+ start:33829 stop:35160 length:1332 start_codon:yes stop_codon:yes gene_type:complete